MQKTTAIANPANPAPVDPSAPVFTAAELKQMAADQDAQYKKNVIRAAIQQGAGDPLSLLGTTADAVQMLMISMAELLDGISKATTLAEVKAAAASNGFAGAAGQLLADVQAGAVSMPYTVKGGVAAIMPDITSRADAVAKVIAAK